MAFKQTHFFAGFGFGFFIFLTSALLIFLVVA